MSAGWKGWDERRAVLLAGGLEPKDRLAAPRLPSRVPVERRVELRRRLVRVPMRESNTLAQTGGRMGSETHNTPRLTSMICHRLDIHSVPEGSLRSILMRLTRQLMRRMAQIVALGSDGLACGIGVAAVEGEESLTGCPC